MPRQLLTRFVPGLLLLVAACHRERADRLADDGAAGDATVDGGAGGLAAGGEAATENGSAAGAPTAIAGAGGVPGVGEGGAPSPGARGGESSAGEGGEGSGTGGAYWGLCGLLPEGPCGDSVLHCGEECDTDIFFIDSCGEYGFEAGTLSCREDCTVDTSDCTGTERCDDGRDNDGDGRGDCVDEDCADDCGDACAESTPLADPGSVGGTTVSQPNTMDPSCVIEASGPELVYEVIPIQSGELEVRLATFGCLVVSARTDCTAAESELGCGVGSRAAQPDEVTFSVPAVAGEPLYVIVEGCDPSFAGDFTLAVASVRS